MSEYLTLKWGTLKGWEIPPENTVAQAAGERLFALGERSMSVAMQRDTPEQKAALCDLIDAVNGEIWNDWTGEKMTKEEAKKYVMEYQVL